MKEFLQTVRRIQIRTSRMVDEGFAGAYHSAFKGRGIEFEDVREYQAGDDVRSIDWNVTARMDRPYVKNFREERELTVNLLVDLSSSVLFGTGEKRKREYIAELAAVLAFSAMRNNDKVGLILFSDRVEFYLPPKRGLQHLLRAIRELLVAEAEGGGTDIGEALTFLGRVQKRRGVAFLISDFMAPPAPKELALIAKRHDLIGLSVTDPMERTFPNLGLLRIRDLESGVATLVDTANVRMAREKQLEETKHLLIGAGATFVDLQTEKDYMVPLKRCFAQRGRR